MAFCNERVGMLEKAEGAYQPAYEMRLAENGPDDSETVQCLFFISDTCYVAMEYSKAKDVLLQFLHDHGDPLSTDGGQTLSRAVFHRERHWTP
mmetsp:Transcript_16820/g.65728  ORF Transcript_16820/g.65728 Transcript_16820/m.65728 type:complete len:93 (-) Transcript_16820:1527-1805(-)